MNRSREIARAIEASLATETARKRGLVEVFLSRGLTPPPPPPNEASASVDASEETLARENEGGGDIDDEKDANGDEETIEGLKRALASSQARARVLKSLRAARFSSSREIITCFSTVVPTIATSTRVSLLPVRLAPPNRTEPNDAQSTPVHRRERVER